MSFSDNAVVGFASLPFELRFAILRINTRAAFKERIIRFDKLYEQIPKPFYVDEMDFGVRIIKPNLAICHERTSEDWWVYIDDNATRTIYTLFDNNVWGQLSVTPLQSLSMDEQSILYM